MAPSVSKPLHFIPDIKEEDFERGKLELSSSNQQTISKAVVRNVLRIKENRLTSRQEAARAKLNLEKKVNWISTKNLVHIKYFFDLFDDYFFGGLLKDHCQFELVETIWMERRYGSPVRGIMVLTSDAEDNSVGDPKFRLYAMITLRVDPKYRLRNYMSCLLHEMVHAILFLYCCECAEGCRELCDSEDNHGEVWLAPTGVIEQVKIFDKCTFDLSRQVGMTLDILHGGKLPSEVVLRKLDLDIGWILEDIEWMRQQNRSVWQKEARAKKLEIGHLKSNRCLRNENNVDGWEAAFGYQRRVGGKAYWAETGNENPVNEENRRRRTKARVLRFWSWCLRRRPRGPSPAR